jgi:hypothetical protein
MIKPEILGTALGLGIMALFLPGGYDAFNFYLRAPFEHTTAPAWVYLFTYPIGYLPWPLSWSLLTILTIMTAAYLSVMIGNRRWWVGIFSAAMLWNLWLGQIEVFPLVGVLISFMVLRMRAHPIWLGLAWLGLFTKPQVGLGLWIVFLWYLWTQRGFKPILWGALSFSGTLLFTFLLWPGWLTRWLVSVNELNPTWWNAAVWPVGLVAIPAAVLPVKMKEIRRLRLTAAATLLASPYFALYHCTTLLMLSENPISLVLSWVPVAIGSFFYSSWMQAGWLLPAMMIGLDLGALVLQRRKALIGGKI